MERGVIVVLYECVEQLFGSERNIEECTRYDGFPDWIDWSVLDFVMIEYKAHPRTPDE